MENTTEITLINFSDTKEAFFRYTYRVLWVRSKRINIIKDNSYLTGDADRADKDTDLTISTRLMIAFHMVCYFVS